MQAQAPFIPNSAIPKLRSVDLNIALNGDCCASMDLVVRLAAAAIFPARGNCRCRTRFRKRQFVVYITTVYSTSRGTTARNPSMVTSSATM